MVVPRAVMGWFSRLYYFPAHSEDPDDQAFAVYTLKCAAVLFSSAIRFSGFPAKFPLHSPSAGYHCCNSSDSSGGSGGLGPFQLGQRDTTVFFPLYSLLKCQMLEIIPFSKQPLFNLDHFQLDQFVHARNNLERIDWTL
jgi:hypothetical protein